MKNNGKISTLFLVLSFFSCSDKYEGEIYAPVKFTFINETNHKFDVFIKYKNINYTFNPLSTNCFTDNEHDMYPFIFDSTKVVIDDTLALYMSYDDDDLYVNDYNLNLLHRNAYKTRLENDTLYRTYTFTEDYFDFVKNINGK